MMAICGVQLKNRITFKDVLLILGFRKPMILLAMESSVHSYGHVLSSEDGHVLRKALEFEVEGQTWEGRLKGS